MNLFRIALIVLAILIIRNASFAQPAAFILSDTAQPPNPALFRLDATTGHAGYTLEREIQTLHWLSSAYPPGHPEYNPEDSIRYTVFFILDSALADGRFTTVERSLPSDDNGRTPACTLNGQQIYNLVWTDGIAAKDRTDSLVAELRWYVRATNSAGLTSYTDTAGVSLDSPQVPRTTPPLVVSVNHPPTPPRSMIQPTNGTSIGGIAGYDGKPAPPIDIIWNLGKDANLTAGIKQGLFNEYDAEHREWFTPVDDKYHRALRTVDTLEYQWVGTVVDAWPKSASVIGTTIVKPALGYNAIQLTYEDMKVLFDGLPESEIDTIAVHHFVLARDAKESDGDSVRFPYKDGIWPSMDAAAYHSQIDWSESGSRPHITKSDTSLMFLIRKGWENPDIMASTMTLSAYPNPASGTIKIRFTLTEPGPVTLEVYNLFGQRVASVQEAMSLTSMSYTHWHPPANLKNGMYVLVLTANGKRAEYPIIFVRK